MKIYEVTAQFQHDLFDIHKAYIQYITLHFELDLVFLVEDAQLQVSPFLLSGHYGNSYWSIQVDICLPLGETGKGELPHLALRVNIIYNS